MYIAHSITIVFHSSNPGLMTFTGNILGPHWKLVLGTICKRFLEPFTWNSLSFPVEGLKFHVEGSKSSYQQQVPHELKVTNEKFQRKLLVKRSK